MNRVSISRRAVVCALVFPVALALFGVPPGRARPVQSGKNGRVLKRLLIVTVTKGYRHADSIPLAEQTLAALGAESGDYTVDYARTDSDLAAKMSLVGLRNYDGVVFASTTGDLPLPDGAAFLQWIRQGHAFIGIHAATDTRHGDPAYLDMIGAEFKRHGPQVTVTARVDDPRHPATTMLGDTLTVHDEIYQFVAPDRAKMHRLLSLDRNPETGVPGFYPLAWCRMYGHGRVFYTALGHRPDVWRSAWYPQHLLGGIQWALGLKPGDAVPQP